MPHVSLAASPGPAAQAVVLPVRPGAVPHACRAAAAASGFAGYPETTCDLLAPHPREPCPPPRTLLVGMGHDDTGLAFEAAGALAASHVLRLRHIALDARNLTPAQAASFAAGASLRAWRYEALRTTEPPDAPRLARIDLVTTDPAAHAAWHTLAATLAGLRLARDLVTEPSNTLTPAGFVARLAPLREAGVTIEVLDEAALRQQGFGALLAVGAGSCHPPCLAVLRWPGTRAQPPVAFVGKGITFDTGGISIKPADRMWDMRGDMAGAAACAGAILALALRRSPAPAIAVLPLAENTTGAASYRPGDVLHTHAGLTVQVVDTDAEGRLVLADALSYAASQAPQAIIDLATLTGSIVTALGHERAGLFSNDPALCHAITAAGEAAGEPCWPMPFGAAYRRALDSDIADIKHCVDERLQPDACQAAAFLQEFTADIPWAHLDMAGVSARDEATPRHAKGATGWGVRLLDHLMAEHFHG